MFFDLGRIRNSRRICAGFRGPLGGIDDDHKPLRPRGEHSATAAGALWVSPASVPGLSKERAEGGSDLERGAAVPATQALASADDLENSQSDPRRDDPPAARGDVG